MRSHLIQVGFFGLEESNKLLLMENINLGGTKYIIEKYDKLFNINLKNIVDINCSFIDIHCMCMVFNNNNENSLEYIKANYDKIKQTIELRNELTSCVFLMVCVCDEELCELCDEIHEFVDKKKLLFTTVTTKDLSNFISMYNQILKTNFLETMSVNPNCSCIIF